MKSNLLESLKELTDVLQNINIHRNSKKILDIQEQFLKSCQDATEQNAINFQRSFKLPSPETCESYGISYDQMIESFIAVIISVISLKNNEEHIYRFLGVFLSSLRNEPAVFDKFKPS